MLSKPCVLGPCSDPTTYHGKGESLTLREVTVAEEIKVEAQLLGKSVSVYLLVPSVWESR